MRSVSSIEHQMDEVMRKIYSHPSEAMVHVIRNELENRGIETVVRGEHAAAVMGGGAGADAWVELWIVDEQRADEASGIVEEIVSEDEETASGDPWTCPRCGSEVEPQFGACWNCGAARPEDGV